MARLTPPTPVLPRSAGVLLHPTSLPAPYGIGDFGPSAYRFIDFLVQAGQSFWQVLPLGPTGFRDSPYQNLSVFAGNPELISLEALVWGKLLEPRRLEEETHAWREELSRSPERANHSTARRFKSRLFDTAFEAFAVGSGTSEARRAYEDFCRRESHWLEDYTLYVSLRDHYDHRSWVEWPAAYRLREPQALRAWAEERRREIEKIKFLQWIFQEQWESVRRVCRERGIQIIGDMPIFVAHDSADVWSHPEMFTLEEDGSLQYQAGVPPDYFSRTGQLWGNPLYRWEVIRDSGFQWFLRRFSRLMALVDWVRIDHFRGFESYWRIPGGQETAEHGSWIKAPGRELFHALRNELGSVPIIAEDLGLITPAVEKLRDRFGFPGMRILQFAFDGDPANIHLTHNHRRNCLVYTGTSDNDTTLGWWEKSSPEEKERVRFYLGKTAPKMPADLIREAYRSVAALAIVPMQDLLGQGGEHRMNFPSVAEGNWQYRMPPDWRGEETAEEFRKLAAIYGRWANRV